MNDVLRFEYEKSAQPKPRAEKRTTPFAATQTFQTIPEDAEMEGAFLPRKIQPLKLPLIKFVWQNYFNTRQSECKGLFSAALERLLTQPKRNAAPRRKAKGGLLNIALENRTGKTAA